VYTYPGFGVAYSSRIELAVEHDTTTLPPAVGITVGCEAAVVEVGAGRRVVVELEARLEGGGGAVVDGVDGIVPSGEVVVVGATPD
jgi:hypothetical protein